MTNLEKFIQTGKENHARDCIGFIYLDPLDEFTEGPSWEATNMRFGKALAIIEEYQKAFDILEVAVNDKVQDKGATAFIGRVKARANKIAGGE